ncbi:hypothetical protein M413DRAFT_292316 [Hebeloma cylindrosporum]|uniref:Uncharacterized protein n=1 Tax=Hebeloma cylindrosporum TaxID=76867 RepID=A0A0C2Y5P1_HEBCY|nr:hypothetical protein M413DRAFT_292316 [Hebeloma cylindrosporum h7]
MVALCSHCGGFGPEDQLITCAAFEGGQCSPCRERAAIRDQIKRLKATHDAIGTVMNAVHDPFIHKLPPEIGSRIFHLSLSTLTLEGRHGAHPDSHIWAWPLKLGSVCRKWRQLAWATPQLWTIVCVGIKYLTTRYIAESLPGLLREWLSRSGALPLTIYFHETWNRFGSRVDLDVKTRNALEVATGSAIDIINLHSGRWRFLHVTGSAGSIKRFASSTGHKQLISLELAGTLLLWPGANFITESELNLTHLKLSRFSFTDMNVRWDKITHATLSEVMLGKALEFLRRASNLEYYCISLSKRRELHFLDPVVHPRLRSVDLWGPDFEILLSKITLPSLEEWTSTQDINDEHSLVPLAAMRSFFKRSRCRVKVLNLNSPILRSSDLDPLLQELPSLERLHLYFWMTEPDEDPRMDDILIRIFDSDPEDRTPEGFLPHLRFMECKTGAPSLSWDLLPVIIGHGRRRLLTLKVFAGESDISNQTAFELLRLEDEGLGLDLQIIDVSTGGDILDLFRIGMFD